MQMKRLILFFALLFANTIVLRSQTVYNYVLNNATKIVNSPTSSFTQTQIAQFKRTALIYMKRKALEQMDSVSTDFLDTQAFYMSEYVTLFFDEIIKAKRLTESKRKEKVMLFMDASVSNPMFKDDDTDTTMSYITDGGEITPFCLNTNWQKAYAAAKSQL